TPERPLSVVARAGGRGGPSPTEEGQDLGVRTASRAEEYPGIEGSGSGRGGAGAVGEDDGASGTIGDGRHGRPNAPPGQILDHRLANRWGGEEEAAGRGHGKLTGRPAERSGDGGDHLGQCGPGGGQQAAAVFGGLAAGREDLRGQRGDAGAGELRR